MTSQECAVSQQLENAKTLVGQRKLLPTNREGDSLASYCTERTANTQILVSKSDRALCRPERVRLHTTAGTYYESANRTLIDTRKRTKWSLLLRACKSKQNVKQ